MANWQWHTLTHAHRCLHLHVLCPESMQKNGNTASGQTDRKKVRGSSTVSPNQHGIKMKIDSGVVSPTMNKNPSSDQIRRHHAEKALSMSVAQNRLNSI